MSASSGKSGERGQLVNGEPGNCESVSGVVEKGVMSSCVLDCVVGWHMV